MRLKAKGGLAGSRGSAITFSLTRSLFTRLKNNPGEDHRLVWLSAGQPRGRHQVFHVKVVPNTFPIIQRAMLFPDASRPFCDASVQLDFVLGNWEHIPINVLCHTDPLGLV